MPPKRTSSAMALEPARSHSKRTIKPSQRAEEIAQSGETVTGMPTGSSDLSSGQNISLHSATKASATAAMERIKASTTAKPTVRKQPKTSSSQSSTTSQQTQADHDIEGRSLLNCPTSPRLRNPNSAHTTVAPSSNLPLQQNNHPATAPVISIFPLFLLFPLSPHGPTHLQIYPWPDTNNTDFTCLNPTQTTWKHRTDTHEASTYLNDGTDSWRNFPGNPIAYVSPTAPNAHSGKWALEYAVATVFVRRAKRAFWKGHSWRAFEGFEKGLDCGVAGAGTWAMQLDRCREGALDDGLRRAVLEVLRGRLAEEVFGVGADDDGEDVGSDDAVGGDAVVEDVDAGLKGGGDAPGFNSLRSDYGREGGELEDEGSEDKLSPFLGLGGIGPPPAKKADIRAWAAASTLTAIFGAYEADMESSDEE